MSTFVFRLKAPRPTFALDMSDEEREIMARHAEHWRPWVESGQMVIFGPVLDGSGSWGLGVVEADDEQELRAFAADDRARLQDELGDVLFSVVNVARLASIDAEEALQGAIGLVQFVIAIAMFAGYRKAGVWGEF